jgi:hypothetical protein
VERHLLAGLSSIFSISDPAPNRGIKLEISDTNGSLKDITYKPAYEPLPGTTSDDKTG